MPLSHIHLHDSAEKSKRKKISGHPCFPDRFAFSQASVENKKAPRRNPGAFSDGESRFQLFTELAVRTETPRVIHLELRTVSRE